MENKIDLAGFNEAMEGIKESSVTSKDYIKFIVGLSTGTILLSVTLVKEFIKFPQYNFILIIGWIFLFVSIILGVWILPAMDNVHVKFGLLKRLATHPEEVTPILKKKLREHYIKELIKGSIPSHLKDDEKIKDFYNSLENHSYEDLEKLAKKIAAIRVKEEYVDVIKDLIRNIRPFYSQII